MKRGGLASALVVVSGADSIDFELRLAVTWLPDLPDPAIGDLVRLTTTGDSDASRLLDERFRTQILDQPDAAYPFTIAPVLIEQEVAAIGKVGRRRNSELLRPKTAKRWRQNFVIIAERRVRLGAVFLAELGRRFEVRIREEEASGGGARHESAVQARNRLTETRVLALLAGRARVTERTATADELEHLSVNGISRPGAE